MKALASVWTKSKKRTTPSRGAKHMSSTGTWKCAYCQHANSVDNAQCATCNQKPPKPSDKELIKQILDAPVSENNNNGPTAIHDSSFKQNRLQLPAKLVEGVQAIIEPIKESKNLYPSLLDAPVSASAQQIEPATTVQVEQEQRPEVRQVPETVRGRGEAQRITVENSRDVPPELQEIVDQRRPQAKQTDARATTPTAKDPNVGPSASKRAAGKGRLVGGSTGGQKEARPLKGDAGGITILTVLWTVFNWNKAGTPCPHFVPRSAALTFLRFVCQQVAVAVLSVPVPHQPHTRTLHAKIFGRIARSDLQIQGNPLAPCVWAESVFADVGL